ncbi:hypothetical protein BJV77DRAFT_1063414 [Russula vinacea]|nr:hypothetical protein BJV77DRAFT_1063414 [Russula vinacea]
MNPPSPSPAHEDNLRRLLDQRGARVDIHHTRFPSLTEFSDSPSIYSHPHFSPRPPHPDASPPQFDFAIPRYARQAFSAMRTDVSLESITPEDDEQDSRMSFLGPTMRFHSLAPWETEGNTTEGVEQEDDARSFVTKRGRSKTRGDGFIKGFNKSASAKATSTARPSFESTISRDKVSVDGQIAPTNLHAQPQPTLSASPATSSSSRPSRPGLFSRARSRTVSHTIPDTTIPPPPPVSPNSVVGSTYASATSPVPTRSISPDPSMYSSTLSPTDVTDASRPTSPLSLRGRSDFVHPYANPDLAYDGGLVHTAPSFLPPSSLGRRMVVPSDSFPPHYHADVLLKKVVGNVQGKVISGPISAIAGHQGQKPASQPGQDKGPLAFPNQIPAVSPTFNLISLQEAQAQARERSRTHVQATPDAPFLQTEPPPRNNASALPHHTGRLRSRTASAGSKTKVEPLNISNPFPPPHSVAEDLAPNSGTGPPPRALKHKKSGFMRLFNGKDKDKPQASSPPPAPPLASPPMPRTPKISSARVPVPTLSPSLVSQSPLQLGSIVKSDGRENEPVRCPRDRENIEQRSHALTILTKDAPPGPTSSQSVRTGVGSSFVVNPDRGLSPASAPPSTTTFPGLSLRPISTVFSAHFADHITSLDSPTTTRSFDEDDPYMIIQQLQDQMKSTRKAWQHQIWELEGQVRDLRAEIDGMRLKELRGERCILCGRSDEHEPDQGAAKTRDLQDHDVVSSTVQGHVQAWPYYLILG